MSLDAYQVFLTAVEKGNLRQAAKLLHHTPSAVSYSISRLEEALGLQLLLRSKHGVQPTRAGRELLPYIHDVLEKQQHLLDAVDELVRNEAETVRIAAFNSACTAWIPGIVKSFAQKHPKIKVEIYQGRYNSILQRIELGNAHLGLLPLSVAGAVDFKLLCRDRIMCVAPMDFVPSSPDYVTVDDIRNQVFIHRADNYDAEIEEIIKENNLVTNSQITVEDDRTLISMIEYGFGITLLPKLILDSIKHNARVFPLIPEEYRYIGLVSSRTTPMTAPARAMHSHIIDYIRQEGILLP